MGDIDLVRPVLDIGTGDGHFASIAYDEPIDVGIDVRSDELVEARDRHPAVYGSVLQASATTLPFADGAFGTVISNCVIEHIADVDGVLPRDRPRASPRWRVRHHVAERALR